MQRKNPECSRYEERYDIQIFPGPIGLGNDEPAKHKEEVDKKVRIVKELQFSKASRYIQVIDHDKERTDASEVVQRAESFCFCHSRKLRETWFSILFDIICIG